MWLASYPSRPMYCPHPTLALPVFSTTIAMRLVPMKMPSPDCSVRRCRCVLWRNLKRAFSRAFLGADMGLLSLFRKAPSSANVAKERLRIIVAQERNARGSPDFLPLLRRALLAVIHKYVNVDPSAVQITLGNEDGHEVLELSVFLPEAQRSV